MKRRYTPDPVYTCLFENEQLVALFLIPELADRFAAKAGGKFQVRSMTLKQAAGVEERTRIGNKMVAAVLVGSLGGLKGGPARTLTLSPARRSEIARIGAKAKWIKYHQP